MKKKKKIGFITVHFCPIVTDLIQFAPGHIFIGNIEGKQHFKGEFTYSSKLTNTAHLMCIDIDPAVLGLGI